MEHKVVKKQDMSKMCFVCGMENAFGIKARFYELDNGELAGIVKPKDEYQGYPNRMHGGVAATILDEVMARCIMIREPAQWGVTGTMSVRYAKPVPLDGRVLAIARIVKNSRRLYEAQSEIYGKNGEKLVEATGKYVKIPLEEIAGRKEETDDFFPVEDPDDPETIEY